MGSGEKSREESAGASEKHAEANEPANERGKEVDEAEGTRSTAKERGSILGRRRPALQGRSPLLLVRAWATVFAVAVLPCCRAGN